MGASFKFLIVKIPVFAST
ncbi:hypothetical protein PENSOL_c105G00109 [Penicillium solitum]|uniref:Uncharacterized protein n=1 Tax=Penicillium solitum TaxID=60172 RepID=A0A1V6Q859_9EURO|nr:hypothetical protein PENSOL_c105G00109 [Penicillium solitum]